MKSRLRKKVAAALSAIPAVEAAKRSDGACERAAGLEEFAAAAAVMIYLPIAAELDPTAIAHAAWAAGKTVLVPKVDWAKRRMDAVVLHSLDEPMFSDRHGLRHPAAGATWPIEKIDLIFAPAMAYDRSGHRLGRGGGFYDRFLARDGLKATICGLGFSEQLLEAAPHGKHDVPVDIVVTDSEVLRCGRDRRGPGRRGDDKNADKNTAE